MVKKVKKQLSTFRQHFFREKYRFDQGNAFLVFLNFSLLVTSLVKQSNGDQNMIIWYVILGFLGTWLLGYILDKFIKVQDAQEKVAVKRSPIWKKNFDHHETIDQKLDDLHEKIDLIKHEIRQNKG